MLTITIRDDQTRQVESSSVCGLFAGWMGVSHVFHFRVGANFIYSAGGVHGNIPGSVPEAALVKGSDGNFYGTTILDGTNLPGFGTIFKWANDGTVTSL